MAVGDKIYIATKEYVEQLLDELNNKVDLAVIDIQSGSFVQSTIADDCVVEVTIEGKTVVTPLDPTQDISPDNPATIKSVGDEPFDLIAVGGKNLVKKATYVATSQYDTCVYAETDVLLPNTMYTISLIVPNGERYYLNEYIFVGGSSKIITGDGTRKIVTATTLSSFDNTNNRLYDSSKGGWKIFKNQTGYTSSGTASNLQIEFGSTATSYEPFKDSNKITISSPVRSIPNTDIHDTLEIYSNGKARLTQRVGKHVVDSTQPILASTSRFVGDFVPVEYKQINDIELVSNSPLFSDMFTQIPASNNNEKYGMIKPNDITTIVFGLNKNDLIGWNDSLSITEKRNLIRQWFANNPVTIYYKLATPIITEIDLTPLHTYKGITNILTTSQLQPTLAAKFYSRLGNFAEVIMARLDQLTQALLALGGTV